MHTQSLGKILASFPIAVRFAGFESDTRRLAAAGWALSMRQEYNAAVHEPQLQLSMRFDAQGSHFYAISHAIDISYGMLREAWAVNGGAYREMSATARVVAERRYTEILAQMGFDIMYMGNGGARFQIFPMRMASMADWRDSFQPIDPRPQETEECGIEDFKFFKVAASPKVKDLIVSPEDVPELLEAVLKAQKPLIEKIKGREQSRRNFEAMGNGFEVKQKHVPIAQIMAVS